MFLISFPLSAHPAMEDRVETFSVCSLDSQDLKDQSTLITTTTSDPMVAPVTNHPTVRSRDVPRDSGKPG